METHIIMTAVIGLIAFRVGAELLGYLIGSLISGFSIFVCFLFRGIFNLLQGVFKGVSIVFLFSIKIIFAVIRRPWLLFMPRRLLVELFKPSIKSVHNKVMKL
ncbi:hypothetical protein BCV02_03760 [Vibrio breoganii]|nr:hypothetical protein BCV02_03760 [Vibrio breoganii]PML89789.1 hypothetical protein BCT67_07655 [Vibrio breoganii]